MSNVTKRGSLLWLQGLLCGGVATLATPTAVLLAALLAPAMLGLVLDRRPGKPMARCILLCGLAACASPGKDFWMAGGTMDAATALLGDPAVLGAAWSAAAGGWLLAELMPLAVRAVLETASRVQTIRLKAEQARLAADWADPADP